jgi:Protein of unknown function (DUF3040)
MTGLRGREQRTLGQIEKPLVLGDPRLASMFAIFTTMTRHEPMPVTERLTPRLRRWRRRARAIMGLFLFTPSSSAGIWGYPSVIRPAAGPHGKQDGTDT